MKLPAAVLFDLDGTLLDTAADFVAVVNSMREQRGLSQRPDELIRAQVSNGSSALIRDGFGLASDHPDFAPLRQELLDQYLAHISVHTRPFPGIAECLALLGQHNIPWGIVTNKPRLYSEALLSKQPLMHNCAVLVCPDDVRHSKPHPEPLLKACHTLGVAPVDTMYIGDHQRDIEAGRAAGMFTIAAAYGYIEESQPSEWQADLLVETAISLTEWLATLLSQKEPK